MDYITLPKFDWFCPDIERPYTFNIYSASRGTDPYFGCTANLIFDYKLRIIVEEDKPFVLHVTFRVVQPWPAPVSDSRTGEKDFECTPVGLTAAKDWLNEEFINALRMGK